MCIALPFFPGKVSGFWLFYFLICFTGSLYAQTYEQYLESWKERQRARFVTYHYLGNDAFVKRGYVSDRPAEWVSNLTTNGSNEIVDPFFFPTTEGDTLAKHVVIMVHGYGAPSVAGGRYYDREAPFFTSVDNSPHETGNSAWFDIGEAGNVPRLHHYLRKGGAEFGFDPQEWVVLGVTLNILPDVGMGLSLLENAERLTALLDVLWANYKPWIRSISLVSHSTGSAVVKAMLGERGATYSNSHPWLAYVDDHINLAGALGGTPSVMIDPVAINRGLGQQLMYGIQHPDDYKSLLDRYTAPQSVSEPFRKKKTYRWPEHINVMSVAGVWDKGTGVPLLPLPAIPRQSLDGNPFSGSTVYLPSALNPLIDPFTIYKLGKTDAVVPNLSVIERTQYASTLTFTNAYDWQEQVDSPFHYEIDWNTSWVMPSLGGDFGDGRMAEGLSEVPGDLVPSSDRSRGTAITYVEIGAEHNGMLRNEYLLRLIKRRLGDVTVQPNVRRPVISNITPAEGPLAGGNTITLRGSHFRHIRYVQFGDNITRDFTVLNENELSVRVPAGTQVGAQALWVVNTAGKNLPQRPLRPGLGPQDTPFQYIYKGNLAAPVILPDGGYFDEPVEISLTSATAGTQIYYSWNNPFPGPNTPASQLYTAPFSIPVNPFSPASSFTLYARAIKAYHFDSPVATAEFSSGLTASAPEITVALPNIPDGTASVSMLTTTEGSSGAPPIIIYTLNGSEPDISSAIYSGPFDLPIGSHVIKARTLQFGYNLSPITTQEYTVYDPSTAVSNPILNPFSTQSFARPVMIRMENYTEGAIIRYTLSSDGSLPPDPTATGAGGTTYTGPFMYDNPGSSFFMKARAFKEGQSPSAIIQSGQITQNAPLAKATVPSVFVNFFENSLRQGLPEGWEGVNGGGGGLSIGGSFASLVLDHAEDRIITSSIEVGEYPQILLGLEISRSGAGAAPLLRVEVSDDDGQSWNYASFVSSIPTTSFERQAFSISNPARPLRFRFSRVNTSGGADGSLSAIRFRQMQVDMEAEPFVPYTFYNDVRVSLSSITTDPNNSSATLATNIVYTLDGSVPDYTQPLQEPNRLYSSQSFPLHSTTSLRAMAFNQSFLTDSDPVTVALRFRCSIPQINVLDTVFADEVRLLLSSLTSNAELKYTLDGSMPGSSSNLYEDTLLLTTGITTVQVRAFRNGYEPSEVASLVIEVEESKPPVITRSPQGLLASAGDDLLLRGQASAFPAPTYQWYKDGQPIAGATADSLRLTEVILEDAGLYKLAAINKAGTTFSEEALLQVESELQPPSILVQPASLQSEEYSSAILMVKATGKPSPAYQWYRDGEAIPGATLPYYAKYRLLTEDAGLYTVRVSNAVGEVESEAADLQVLALRAPLIKKEPQDTIALEGEQAVIAAEVENAGSGWYVWLKNGEPWQGAYSDSLFFSRVALSDSGNYQLIVGNIAGTDTSRIAIFKVLRESAENKAPLVPEFNLEVQQGDTLEIDVLEQISDPDGDAVTILSFTQASHGRVSLSPDQKFIYTTAEEFQPEDAFAFVVQDNRGAQVTGTVQLSISRLTSFGEEGQVSSVKAIYPNPVRETAHISFYLHKKEEVLLLIQQPFGAYKEELWKGKLTAGEYQWRYEINHLPAGMYICIMRIGEQVYRQKILVKP